LGKKEESISANFNIPGAEVVLKYGQYTTVEVSDADVLKNLGEGTKWCTRGSYPECRAEDYIKKYYYIYIVFDGDKPIIQYTPDYSQIMDINDNPISRILEGGEILKHVVLKPDIDVFKTTANLEIVENYFEYVNNDKWPEIEPIIVDKPRYAVEYAVSVIKGEWPEAEEEIIYDPRAAYEYARYVIKKRWPVAEPLIMKSYYAAKYAKYVIKGEWPEAEPYIMHSFEGIHEYVNARYGPRKRRWPAVEAYFIDELKKTDDSGKFPNQEYYNLLLNNIALYIEGVVTTRWPEIEPYLSKMNRAATIYKDRDVYS
jgi:hypothetical protein